MYDSWIMGMKQQAQDTGGNIFGERPGGCQQDTVTLNSEFIDAICNNAFKDDGSPKTILTSLPTLELILSHTIRSVPPGADFNIRQLAALQND